MSFRYKTIITHSLCLCLTCCLVEKLALANESAELIYSPSVTGFLGLNTIPNARMAKTYSTHIGTSFSDPYLNSFIGIQITAPLYIQLRQSAETSNITEDAKRLYPGLDFKLRLLKETEHIPAIAIGVQSALGHKRMSGEYLSMSKKYKNIDITAGIGWGRYGTAAHFDNPLKGISSHFSKNRDYNSEEPASPNNWFTGDSIGLFTGIEYFLPYDGLSLKLDYGADRYIAEQSQFNFNAPAPWSVGLSYQPYSWINAGVALQGTERIMARLSLSGSPEKWPFTHGANKSISILGKSKPNPINIKDVQEDKNTLRATLNLTEQNSPKQINRAAQILLDDSDHNVNKIALRLQSKNITGRTIEIPRQIVEKSVGKNNISTSEIWRNTDFVVSEPTKKPFLSFLSTTGIKERLTLHLQNDFSISEEDSGSLYRTAILGEFHLDLPSHLKSGSTIRVNLQDNLTNIEELRAVSTLPVRSDIASFTRQTVSVENSYISYARPVTPDLYMAMSAGYLEEFYAGFGGEILYRPFGSRFAIGAEAWQAFRRSSGNFNLALNGTNVTTGHAQLWYDLPKHDITLNARIGRFLAGDTGGSVGLEKIFDSGAKLSGEISLSNYGDADLFGGTTHAYHRINLTMPLGSIPFIPSGSTIINNFMPLGRNTAQSLKKPINLYEITENMTYDHIARYWDEFLDE